MLARRSARGRKKMKKVICIEGISGCGKSNLSQYLSIQLTKSNINNHWFFEFDYDNQIVIPNNHNNMIFETTKEWEKYIENNQVSDSIDIFDGRLFLLNIEFSLKNGKSSHEIIEEMSDIINMINGNMKFTIIYMNTSSIEKLFENTKKSRNANDWYLSALNNSKYKNSSNIKDMDSVYSYYNEVNTIMLTLYDLLECDKYMVDVSDLQWGKIQENVLNHLLIQKHEDYSNYDKYEYIGVYENSKQDKYEIQIEDDMLKMVNHPYSNYDPVEKKWTLIPYDKDQFISRGQAIIFNFKRNDENIIDKVYENGFFREKNFQGIIKEAYLRKKS